MTAMQPAGWYNDPATPGQLRYWDGNAWTSHTAPGSQSAAPAAAAVQAPASGLAQAPGADPFAGPSSFAAPASFEPARPFDSADPFAAPGVTGPSRSASGGAIAAIIVGAVVVIGALVAAAAVLIPRLGSEEDVAAASSPTPVETDVDTSSATAGPTDVSGLDILPTEISADDAGTTWWLRYDFGQVTVPAESRDVTRTVLNRVEGDSGYIGGVWSFDGLSWALTESYLYTEIYTTDVTDNLPIDQVADEYYLQYILRDGYVATDITVSTHPAGYEMATFEVTGEDTELFADGTPIPFRHTIVILRDGGNECALEMWRYGITDPASIDLWDAEFAAVVDSYRFWDDIE